MSEYKNMTDIELANELRASQSRIAECYNELNSRGWRIVYWEALDDVYRDNYDMYRPWRPYVFNITKEKVIVPDQEI